MWHTYRILILGRKTNTFSVGNLEAYSSRESLDFIPYWFWYNLRGRILRHTHIICCWWSAVTRCKSTDDTIRRNCNKNAVSCTKYIIVCKWFHMHTDFYQQGFQFIQVDFIAWLRAFSKTIIAWTWQSMIEGYSYSVPHKDWMTWSLTLYWICIVWKLKTPFLH